MDPVATTEPGQTPEAPDWHGESEYLSNDPDAAKAFMDYKTNDDQLRAHREAKRLLGQPFRLPKDHSKLSDEQKNEIRGFVGGMNGVPDSPEGYAFDVPENVHIDDQAMGDFRKLLHERKIDPQTAKDILGVQLGLVDRMNKHRQQVIQGMTDNNYKTFLQEDCNGDKKLAAVRMEMVTRYLQSQFVDTDGKVDTAGWEKFATRIMLNDRIIELPLLRVLYEAASMKMGTGGAPGSFGQKVMAGDGLYSEMRPGKK